MISTCNDEILKWRKFWDIFCVGVHIKKEGMISAEMLLYLRLAVCRGHAAELIG